MITIRARIPARVPWATSSNQGDVSSHRQFSIVGNDVDDAVASPLSKEAGRNPTMLDFDLIAKLPPPRYNSNASLKKRYSQQCAI
jgi:hypothetical protein